MAATDPADHDLKAAAKPRRYRFGYWAIQLEALITLLGATGTLVVGLFIGGGRVDGGEAVVFGVIPILLALCLLAYYRRHYVEIDVANNAVRLSRFGGVSEFSLDQVVLVVPQRTWTLPRAVRLETDGAGVNCPLCHQGQIFTSPRARRFTQALSDQSIKWRPAR